MQKIQVIDLCATAGKRIHTFPINGKLVDVTFPDASTPVPLPAATIEACRLDLNPAFRVLGPEAGTEEPSRPSVTLFEDELDEAIAGSFEDGRAAGRKEAESAQVRTGNPMPILASDELVAKISELDRKALMARVSALPDKGGIANPMTAKNDELEAALLKAKQAVAAVSSVTAADGADTITGRA